MSDKCRHDPHWRGIYGTCMCCAREEAEAKAKAWQEMSTVSERRRDRYKYDLDRMNDAAEMLWTVVANVSGGDWTLQSKEWTLAAQRWRDNYLDAIREQEEPMADDGKMIRGVKNNKATSSDRQYLHMGFVKRYTNKVLRMIFKRKDREAERDDR